mmetsp:Transcript_9965/g.14100  ORF Transcript_9965/g.14100 Transcript_9965/m.14100 type:complete len:257 (-) Transcript_9965:648-1418(-)
MIPVAHLDWTIAVILSLSFFVYTGTQMISMILQLEKIIGHNYFKYEQNSPGHSHTRTIPRNSRGGRGGRFPQSSRSRRLHATPRLRTAMHCRIHRRNRKVFVNSPDISQGPFINGSNYSQQPRSIYNGRRHRRHFLTSYAQRNPDFQPRFNTSTSTNGDRRHRNCRHPNKQRNETINTHPTMHATAVETIAHMAINGNNNKHFIVGVDNHCSQCVSNDISHFTQVQPCDSTLRGIHGGLTIAGKGTIEWEIQEDQG